MKRLLTIFSLFILTASPIGVFQAQTRRTRNIPRVREPASRLNMQLGTTDDGRKVILKSDGTWEFVVAHVNIESKAKSSPSKFNALTNTGSSVFPIAKLGRIPQYKIVYRNRTVARVFGRRIKTKVPVAYRRYATEELAIVVTYPQSYEAQAVRDVEECGKIAVAAAVVGLVEGPPGALAAFNAAFQSCILLKLGDEARQLDIKLRSDMEHTRWTPY